MDKEIYEVSLGVSGYIIGRLIAQREDSTYDEPHEINIGAIETEIDEPDVPPDNFNAIINA